jgi:NAD(P)-dependent dehydrogenase (short-subunit alcohol dehydrogenase family)
MGFDGKVVLVTGSTTGIGEACARAFAEAGAAVMVQGRNVERGKRVLHDIRGMGVKAEFLEADVREAGVGDRLVAETVAQLGRLDVLVNNAGILYGGTAVETTDEQWLDIMAVNVNALFFISRAAVRQMLKQGSGNIVNIASEWGLNGEEGHVAYCASKGAVLQITRCMALDHARDNIRVNSVCPGEIHTQMVDDILNAKGGDLEANLKELAQGVPMKRLASPDEVAKCVRFLASDEASYVTATNFPVDGGNDATGGAFP